MRANKIYSNGFCNIFPFRMTLSCTYAANEMLQTCKIVMTTMTFSVSDTVFFPSQIQLVLGPC